MDMLNEYTNPSVGQLADRWWMLVIRGAAAVLFGVLTFAMPQVSLLSLVLLWGAYAVIDGAFNMMAAIRGARAGRHWGWLLFEGIVSIGAGVVAFAWPGITALALLMVIAVWGVLTGAAAIAAAVRLRKVIQGEWLLALSGALSIAFGVLLVAVPSAGALALLWMIGAYAVVAGLLLIGVGVRLRSWRHGRGRAIPSGGMPMGV
jgi:uncharacterized membrane protein HdeD (DUF308 family)